LLLEKNNLIVRQKEKVEEQKEELFLKNHEIEEKSKEILDSINYAKRIQYALLAHDDLLKQHLVNYFMMFKPKDIVSGDFYWATQKNDLFYLAVCDSTGHGVPGAFMSLLNISFLNEAINEKGISKPGEIFDHVRKQLITNLYEARTEESGGRDGMDGILFCFDFVNKTIRYASANNTPALVRNSEMIYLETDKMPVGLGEKKENFNTYSCTYLSGDIFYLYTDGYADQFGGPKGKKFKYKQLDEMLVKNAGLNLSQQQTLIEKIFFSWKQDLEQIDDVCVAGILMQ
jgi:serine phosphatase RsbU (regulator of sigma subunit)